MNPLIQQSMAIAELAGKDYLQQGLAMVEALKPLHVDDNTLAAAMLYSSVLYTDLDEEDIKENLGAKVNELIQHTKQLEGISGLYNAATLNKQDQTKIDNIRRMSLAMVNDVRAVLIKLAEQLVKLREAKFLSEAQQRQIGEESMAIYGPLANRLGIADIKWEMEDLAFRYLNSQQYKKISQLLKHRRIERENYVKKIIATLTTMVQQAGIKNAQVSGRVKHIYSIYRKMQRKHLNFNQIHDATAVRVMVPTIEDCYQVLGDVHAAWKHIPEEFDDYIATPKPNGYKSIHTAVMGPENRCVEIQIRTQKMHEEAELGMAAHWVYKEGAQGASYEAKIAWLRQVLAWQQEISHTDSAIEDAQKIFADRIYVFTPKSDIIDLQQGATVLDFAYHIHSDVGHSCRGAKVDGDIVNLTYRLQTGDEVEILTNKEPRPSRDWLNSHLGFLATSKARTKVHSWFKKQDYEKNIIQGQESLERELRRLHLKNVNIANMARKLGYKIPDDLYAALGSGGGDIKTRLIALLKLKPETADEMPAPKLLKQPSAKKNAAIEIQGVDNLLTKIANCCQPLPGDDIVGYVTQGQGVSIHRQDCFNILKASQEKPERLLEVSWNDKGVSHYPVNLIVEACDRQGLVKDITNVITNEKLILIGLNCGVNKKDSMAYINLTVEVPSLDLLDQVTAKIKQLSDVITVRR